MNWNIKKSCKTHFSDGPSQPKLKIPWLTDFFLRNPIGPTMVSRGLDAGFFVTERLPQNEHLAGFVPYGARRRMEDILEPFFEGPVTHSHRKKLWIIEIEYKFYFSYKKIINLVKSLFSIFW